MATDPLLRIPRLALARGCSSDVIARGWRLVAPYRCGSEWQPGSILAGLDEWGSTLEVPPAAQGRDLAGVVLEMTLQAAEVASGLRLPVGRDEPSVGQQWIQFRGGWLPGAVSVHGERVLEVSPGGWPRFEGDTVFTFPDRAAPPDPDDPATLGTWLATVRKRVGDPGASVWRARPEEGKPEYWEVSACPGVVPCTLYGCGNSEAAALLDALKASR